MLRHLHLPRAGLAAFALLLAACGDTNLLPPATQPTVEDTVTLWAVTGTAIDRPSAYDVIGAAPVRTDMGGTFDFLFDFRLAPGSTTDTVPVLVPRGADGMTDDAGLQLVVRARFDTLRVAPTGGYEFNQAVPVDTGSVLFVRSRLQQCNFGLSYGIYGKLQPLFISRTQRWIRFRILYDPNCGYRGLGPGVPTI